MEQLFFNLLSNAFKFTPAGGTVTVTLRLKGGYIHLSVADTGCGISPEVLPHIFEQGFSTGGSSGLGLSICLDAVKTHSGEIWVERTGETGTVFAFTVLKEDFA